MGYEESKALNILRTDQRHVAHPCLSVYDIVHLCTFVLCQTLCGEHQWIEVSLNFEVH